MQSEYDYEICSKIYPKLPEKQLIFNHYELVKDKLDLIDYVTMFNNICTTNNTEDSLDNLIRQECWSVNNYNAIYTGSLPLIITSCGKLYARQTMHKRLGKRGISAVMSVIDFFLSPFGELDVKLFPHIGYSYSDFEPKPLSVSIWPEVKSDKLCDLIDVLVKYRDKGFTDFEVNIGDYYEPDDFTLSQMIPNSSTNIELKEQWQMQQDEVTRKIKARDLFNNNISAYKYGEVRRLLLTQREKS